MGLDLNQFQEITMEFGDRDRETWCFYIAEINSRAL